ncbi:MAG TPA: response regulator [Azospirillum sp.]
MVVIEDNLLILQSLRMLLEGWGYAVVAAASGEEALALLGGCRRTPHVIVTDYRLPHGQTGLEAIRDIHDLYGVRIPAVVLTGETAPDRIADILRHGCRLLSKPVSASALREALAAT